MRILLIDDEPDINERLALYLERDGHAVESLCWVEDQAALNQVLDAFRPDGVVLDFEMEPPGIEIYRWLVEWRADLRVAFYTKYGKSPDHLHRMQAAGVGLTRIVAKEEAGADARRLLDALDQRA